MGDAAEDVAGGECTLVVSRVALPFCLGAYIPNSNKPVTKLLVPVGVHLMEKRVELESLRAVGRWQGC